MGYLYDSSSGSRATLAQKADHIAQWVLEEADIEVEIPSAMASISARKLCMKRYLWTGSICDLAVDGGYGCQSGATVCHQ